MFLILAAGCHHDIGETDSAFYAWNGGRVHCAVDIDTSARIDLPSIVTGLDRARDRGEVVELFTHQPGVTIPWSRVEDVLSAAHDRGLPFITYTDFAHDITPTAGLAFSFDDWYPKDWIQGRDMFKRYGARLTFFVAHYDVMSQEERDDLQLLASDGHDIEPHTINHLRGPAYVEENGLRSYIDVELQPSIDLLRADGYPVTAFAYPFGARTGELDGVVFDRVPIVRSVAYTWTSVAVDPCPI
ncbi:MAG: hypothetical protein JWO36_2888 [Myxococcales bacterium]|nr:hypothetical protein [Myxococcales bacterium]